MRLPLPFAAALALGIAVPALAQTVPPAQPEAAQPVAPAPAQVAAPATSAPATAQAAPPAAPAFVVTQPAAPAPAEAPPAASAPVTAQATQPATPTPPAEAASPAAPGSGAASPAPAQPVPTEAAALAPAATTAATTTDAAASVPSTPADGATDATTADTAPATVPSAPTEPTPAIAPVEIPPVSLSPEQMFRDADIVVQSVMIGLLIASVVTWTVFLVKLVELTAAIRRAGRSLRRIEPAPDLAGATKAMAGRSDPASAMLHAAAGEMARSAAITDAAPGVKERVASHLDRIEARAGRRIARGTGLLAIIGSTAPFVGLFGTVWGIMNSFIGIAEAQTSNLAVVAPGIAEALLATGLGLVAAIPAVVIYNLLARATAGYRLQLGDASAAVQRLVSRELDREAAA